MSENIYFGIMTLGWIGGMGWIITTIYTTIRDRILERRWEEEFAKEFMLEARWRDDLYRF